MNQAKKVKTTVQDPKVKATLIGLGFLTLSVGAWFGYSWYTIYNNKQAQKLLGECLDEYQKTVDSVQPLWSEVAEMNKLAHYQAEGTALAPFFIVMQAQAFAREGDIDKAVKQMQQAIDSLGANSPYTYYFALTQGLMLLDAKQAEDRKQGFAQLQDLAQNMDNPYRDAAEYHVGDYYYADGNFGQAKKVWQALASQKDVWEDSPWVARAQEKLSVAF